MFLLILLEFTHNFARLRKMMDLVNYHFLMLLREAFDGRL